MEIESALESIGLTRQETVVYTTSLKLGTAKASIIAQKSGIQRGGGVLQS
jgi:sugar-specific transcriptional regulator TrmB